MDRYNGLYVNQRFDGISLARILWPIIDTIDQNKKNFTGWIDAIVG